MSRSFNGSNTRVNNDTTWSVSLPFTLSVWVRPAALTSIYTPFCLGAAGGDSLFIRFDGVTAGDPLMAVHDSDAQSSASSGASGIAANTWFHAAATFSANNARAIFLNGVKSTNGNSRSATAALTRVCFGAEYDNSTRNFLSGQLAEGSWWNVALSDGEIRGLAKGASPLRTRPQSLIDYWPLDGTGASEPGRKGNLMSLVNSPAHHVEHPPVFRR